MFGLGFSEIVVIFVLILLFVGPAKLPEIARGIGKGMREIRRATRELDSVPEIRDLRRAVDEIRSPVADTLRESVLDADLAAPSANASPTPDAPLPPDEPDPKP